MREKAPWWKPIRVSLATNNISVLNMVHSLFKPNCPHAAMIQYTSTHRRNTSTPHILQRFKHPYPHAPTRKGIVMGTDTHVMHTETHMHTAHRHEAWHSLPWLRNHWMNHPEICPFYPKPLASKSHSAVKSRQQSQWVMLLHVCMTCTKDKCIIQQALWKNSSFSTNDKCIVSSSLSEFLYL